MDPLQSFRERNARELRKTRIAQVVVLVASLLFIIVTMASQRTW